MEVMNDSLSAPATSVRDAITRTFIKVANEQGKILAPLSDDLALMDSGLDSLCIAIIVARLDDELGKDPFSGSDEMVLPITVGDFIRIYENATS
jgi:acyl carrier protein